MKQVKTTITTVTTKTVTTITAIDEVSFSDINNLVNSRMYSPEWRAQQHVMYSPSTECVNDPVLGDCTLVNGLANSPTYGTIYTRFVCPPGCTTATLKIKIKLPDGATANSIRFGLYLPDFSGFVNGLLLTSTPSSTPTEYDQIYDNLIPGSTYFVIANFNYPSQAACLVKSVEVIPSNGDGLFGDIFRRISVDKSWLLYNGYPELWYEPGMAENVLRSSCNTRYPVQTDATKFAIEYATDLSGTDFSQYRGIGLRIDNVPSLLFNNAGFGHYLDTFDLINAGNKRIEFYIPPTWKGYMPGSNTHLRAIYVGDCSTLTLPGELYPTAPKFLIIGDSAACGFYGDLGYDAWSILTDSGRVKAVFRACAGQSLFDTCSTEAARIEFIASLASIDFDSIYFEVSANDAVSTLFGSVQGFKDALSDVVDKFHLAYPTKGCYIQSAIIWAQNDSVVEQYRVVQAEIAADRAWVHFIDGSVMLDATDLIDTYHPSPAGHVKWADKIGTAIGV